MQKEQEYCWSVQMSLCLRREAALCNILFEFDMTIKVGKVITMYLNKANIKVVQ